MGLEEHNKVDVLVVGAGPAGLACAIRVKMLRPEAEVVVIEKGAEVGNHNLSGAVMEESAVAGLLDAAMPDWRKKQGEKGVPVRRVDRDDIMFFTKKRAVKILPMVRLGKRLGLGFGRMVHTGDYIISISEFTALLGRIAKNAGVEVLTGFAAEDIVFDEASGLATGVKLVDQGLDKEGNRQPNYLAGEVIEAGQVVLAEGCDGLVTEKFIKKAALERQCPQLYSVAVKEIIKVTSEQYKAFGAGRVVHAMGYPLWRPGMGPAMFGGGIMYPVSEEHIAVGMIVGADWKYFDFNPQDGLVNFKNHPFVKRFIDGGKVVEAGAKMIPEGGWYAVPRDKESVAIGKGNVVMLGDGAGFVNMLKIKGLHNAISSGMAAGEAIVKTQGEPCKTALVYTELLEEAGVTGDMKRARNFRQTVARFGPLQGMPLSALGTLLPQFKVEEDYKAMAKSRYVLRPSMDFDKDTFTAMAGTHHREGQKGHLSILDSSICREKCTPVFKSPCITFCPAGVYETVGGEVKPANPSNCLHCKTCQRKCPFDNIRWTVPEGTGGPRYKRM